MMEQAYKHSHSWSERRRHPRLNIALLNLTTSVRTAITDEVLMAHLVDISLGGCCIALPAAEAHRLQENGACLCALRVGIAGYPCEYRAAVIARRGDDSGAMQLIHLRFNNVTKQACNLLARWIAHLDRQVRQLEEVGALAPELGCVPDVSAPVRLDAVISRAQMSDFENLKVAV
ncbi:MAG TPA: PilZ domain-containing protein [Chloroflexota bacterium]|nr:PilZ domain-containing protein [Chloroflexota bacterium]